jgi:hypothetical protein
MNEGLIVAQAIGGAIAPAAAIADCAGSLGGTASAAAVVAGMIHCPCEVTH